MKRPLPQRSPGLARHLAASLIAALTIAPGLGACVGDECANVMCGQCDGPGLWVQVQEVASGPFLADATVTAGGHDLRALRRAHRRDVPV